MTMTIKDFSRWTPNIEVSVWGAGKATLCRREECPTAAPPGARYAGDCDNCEMFMGIKFPDNFPGNARWGDRFKACCWAKLEPAAVTPAVSTESPA